MVLSEIENILQSSDLTEIFRPLLDISYLLTVFLSVFLANVTIETVKSINGMSNLI